MALSSFFSDVRAKQRLLVKAVAQAQPQQPAQPSESKNREDFIKEFERRVQEQGPQIDTTLGR